MQVSCVICLGIYIDDNLLWNYLKYIELILSRNIADMNLFKIFTSLLACQETILCITPCLPKLW